MPGREQQTRGEWPTLPQVGTWGPGLRVSLVWDLVWELPTGSPSAGHPGVSPGQERSLPTASGGRRGGPRGPHARQGRLPAGHLPSGTDTGQLTRKFQATQESGVTRQPGGVRGHAHQTTAGDPDTQRSGAGDSAAARNGSAVGSVSRELWRQKPRGHLSQRPRRGHGVSPQQIWAEVSTDPKRHSWGRGARLGTVPTSVPEAGCGCRRDSDRDSGCSWHIRGPRLRGVAPSSWFRDVGSNCHSRGRQVWWRSPPWTVPTCQTVPGPRTSLRAPRLRWASLQREPRWPEVTSLMAACRRLPAGGAETGQSAPAPGPSGHPGPCPLVLLSPASALVPQRVLEGGPQILLGPHSHATTPDAPEPASGLCLECSRKDLDPSSSFKGYQNDSPLPTSPL